MMDLNKFSNKRICVATSGGADSLSLLHYLWQRQEKYGYTLSALHCEHGIRGEESLADAEFVKEICQAWNIPLYTFAENCPLRAKNEGVSLETAARNFRLECYQKVVEQGEDFVATAHHKDDEAETVLFRLARGASLSGMKGISEVNGYMVRPFLSWSRSDIEKYAQENKLSYRVDCTNFELDATRNKLRFEVLPKLEKAVPGAKGNIAKFAFLAAEDDELLYKYAQALLLEKADEELGYTIQVQFCDERALFRRACLLALKRMGVERDYTFTHLETLVNLQNSERGATLDMPQNIVVKKQENCLLFYNKPDTIFLPKTTPIKFTEEGFDGGRYEVDILKTPPEISGETFKILCFDREKLPQDAVFRFRKEGDEIQSFGGRKTLKKFFNEKKVEPQERGYLPLIASENTSEVYAVCGVEISEKIKITDETHCVLYITVQKKKEN